MNFVYFCRKINKQVTIINSLTTKCLVSENTHIVEGCNFVSFNETVPLQSRLFIPNSSLNLFISNKCGKVSVLYTREVGFYFAGLYFNFWYASSQSKSSPLVFVKSSSSEF